MRRTPGRARSAFLPFLLVSTALSSAAYAQVETIVVTAEKRAESLQRVPFSITALSTEKLEQLDAHNFNDYVKYLPSVTFTVGQPSGGGNGAPGFATVTMRGVSSGNDGNHSGSLPTVGVYLDETPITTIGGTLDIQTYDVARVEALAGPQGTLYGASSEAGTIRIITNKPDPSAFSMGAEAEANIVEKGGKGGTLEGFVNIPLSDNAAIRIVAWDEHDPGYINNVHGTRFFPTSGVTLDNSAFVKDNYNTVDKFGARAALKVDLNENWTATATVMGQNELSSGLFAYDPSVGPYEVQHFFPEYAHDHWYQAALTIEGKVGDLDLVYSGSYMERWINEASDYTDYGFVYDTLYPPSYFGNYFFDNAGNKIPPAQHINAQDLFSKDSQEVRVTSPSTWPIRFVAGLFYERQTHWIFQDYLVDNLANSLWVPGWTNTIWLTDQDRVDRDYAAFAQASYDITPKLTLLGGLRVFEANNSLDGFFGFSSNFSSHTGVSQCFKPFVMFDGAPCTNLDKSVVETGYTHKLSLQYQIDDDRMIYGTWSTGYRPGGINRRGTVPPYQPDKLINYEVGWKTSWLDGKLVFNGALFWEDWQQFQFSFLGVNSFTEIHNASSATIRGVEADVVYQPLEGLNLSASGTFADGHLNAAFCGPTGVNVCPSAADPQLPDAPSGTMLPGSPRFKINGQARYDYPIGHDWKAYGQLSVLYQSSEWSDLRTFAADPLLFSSGFCIPGFAPPGTVCARQDPVRALLGQQPSFTLFDLAAGLETDRWTVELNIKNLADTKTDLYTFTECATQVCGHEPYIVTNPPRTFGIRIAYKSD